MQVAHRRRDLPVLAAAIGVSALGDWLALLPLNLQLRSMGGSGLTVAALFLAVLSPAALLAAPAGALADRVDRRRLLVAASLAEAAVAVALAFAGSAATILPLAALLGTFSAIATPAEFSLVPAIVQPDGVRRANGWVETARYAGFIGGPTLGGILAAAGGVKAALLIDAATFAAVALAAFSLRPRPVEHDAATAKGRMRDGITYLFADRALALVMAAAFASLLFMTASAPAEVFFAKDVLHTGDVGFGVWLTALPLGMAIGAALLGRRMRGDLAGAALAAIMLQGLGVAGPAIFATLAFSIASFFAGGLAHAILDKPARLTEAEYEVIKEHPRSTEEILLHVPIFSGLVVPAAAHHERVDGRGYHRGIAGEAIPAMSRVLACADVYEALTAKRSYRDPMSPDDALALMRRDVGAAFFPEPFAALCAHVDAHALAA